VQPTLDDDWDRRVDALWSEFDRPLAGGLAGSRRRQAVIQLASALRNLGRVKESIALALGALARHLPHYNRSLANYARALAEEKVPS